MVKGIIKRSEVILTPNRLEEMPTSLTLNLVLLNETRVAGLVVIAMILTVKYTIW